MYQSKLNTCERAYQDFKKQINTLKNKFKDDLELYVFEKRFLRGWSIKRIANYLHYSVPRINQVIKKIKSQMEDK